MAKKEVLSQSEIDQLLQAIENSEDDECETPLKGTRRIKIYDFKRPDVFSKEQIRTMANGAESYARLVKKYFSSLAKSPNVNVHLASTDQLTFEEFMRSIPSPTAFSYFTIDGHKAFFEIDPTLEFELLKYLNVKYDKLEKDNKNTKENKNRDLCDSEREAFIESVYNPLYSLMGTVVHDYFLVDNPNIKIDNKTPFENNPWYIQALPPHDMVCLSTFDCEINGAKGCINVCMSTKCAQHLINSYNEIEPNEVGPFNFAELMKTTVPIEVVLGRTNKSLNDIKNIGEGTIIELDKLAGEPVDIKVNGKVLAKGEVVVIDENFGVRVTDTVQD